MSPTHHVRGVRASACVAVAALVAFGGVAAWSSAGAASAQPPADVIAGEPDGGRDRSQVALADGNLRTAVAASRAGTAIPSHLNSAPDGRLLVELLSGLPTAEAVELVEGHGGVVAGSVPDSLVLARVPVASLEALEAEPGVHFLTIPQRVDAVPEHRTAPSPSRTGGPLLQIGDRTGEHVSKMNATEWHDAGLTGQDVKIGILDGFGRDVWDAAVQAGEVKQPLGTFCRSFGEPCNFWSYTGDPTIAHGVGVAEIVSDIAPGADYYLVHATSRTDVRAAVDFLADRGVTVITRSLSALYDGPGDGTGPSGDIVRYAISRGIAWFNSAGNAAADADRIGGYWRDTFKPMQVDVGEGEMWTVHDFGNGASILPMLCGLQLGLRWNDWGAGNPTDYDLFMVETDNDGATWSFVGAPFLSEIDQQNQELDHEGRDHPIDPADPIERIEGCPPPVSGVVYGYVIRLYEAGNGADDTLEMMINAGALAAAQTPHSATQPFADLTDPGAIAVGAIGDEPRGGGSTIAPYSSQGPNNANEPHPTLSAGTCLTTFAFGADCFNGTSASAPAVAGASALVLGAGVANGPGQLDDYLANHAVDHGAAGHDNAFGAGEVVLGPSPDPPPPPPPPSPPPIRGINPARLLETRDGPDNRTVDGQQEAIGRRGAGSVTRVRVAGRGGVPQAADAALLNVTAINPANPGYLTVFPCGSGRPDASNVNYRGGQVVPNAVLAGIGDSGEVCVYTTQPTHLVVDVSGFVPDGGSPEPLNPARLYESRSGSGLRTVDRSQEGVGRLPAGRTAQIDVTGRGGVPNDATAALLNVTAVQPGRRGHLTVFSCGTTRPLASNVNYGEGEVVPNAVLAQIGTGGRVCVYSTAATDLVVDVNGFVPEGGAPVPVQPARLLESRSGGRTIDGVANGIGRRRAGSETAVVVAGRGGVPGDARGVFLNVTAIAPDRPGYLTIWPCGSPRPNASNVNYQAGQVVPNAVFTQVGDGGRVCVYTLSATDVIVDVNGYSQ